MNDNSFFTSFLSVVLTTKEANELVERIDTILARLYLLDRKGVLEILEENMNADIVDALEYSLRQNNANISSQQVIKSFLQRLQSDVRACAIVSITIAHFPTESLQRNIGLYCKQIFGVETLLEIHVDSTILGGAVVMYKGRYLNASIKRKLDDYFENAKT